MSVVDRCQFEERRRLASRGWSRVLDAALLVIWAVSMASPGAAQGGGSFDPVATARLRAGEIFREIIESGRDPSLPEPTQVEVFNTGLLLQAGLRALLPVADRRDIALPGTPSPSDPKPLVEAQENYKAVFESGAEATAAQKTIALSAVKAAAQQLSSEGYSALSITISEWLRTQ
jgi:hypothetical protein